MAKQKHKQQKQSLSRMLAYILGRRPDEFGLFTDEEGFISIKELLIALREEEGWSFVRESHLETLIREPEDTSFEIVGKQVRVAPEDSHLELGPFPEATPPALLYYAARRKAYPAIHQHGLKPGQWPWVPLFQTKEMALRVGSRREIQPILLTIQAAKASQQGTIFYRSQELIYLVKELSPKFFYAPPQPKKKPVLEKKKPQTAPEPTTPGTFVLDPFRDPDPTRRQQLEKKKKEKKGQDWKRASRKKRREKYR
ncbi:MAG: RNA 2'-phosphotransferase [Deltaproteobacteria bacterium]|nr:RNA 2'-phosphotransferase [Deltaproteobacteria bacterium]MBW2050863.1 RNA 2'-phosphotransferase [Deltaproteobacteria bacterium]MBW2140183.1 RNA 2'-phosphotransferase [Deltaproteobacteria bacterium]MBW2322690.1 RNA 2'-phosphotransferase [Deltaproteobacteria bacterium]